MSKKTKQTPEYSGGAIKINGETKASTQRVGNDIITNYNMSDTEKNIYDSVLNNMDSSLTDFFRISDPQRQAWNEELNAMRLQGISDIENIYTPMQNNLKNDIAARFGNLDNSTFLNNLKKIADNRAAAVAQLSTNLALKQNDLYKNELLNRMNVINFLNGLNTSFNDNILNYAGNTSKNISSGNSYNQWAYNNSLSNSNDNSKMYGQMSESAVQLAALLFS